ncbi:unnamed protein product [Moneuplotes crassus]|uniref:RING-type domain-containing protein n=2 Tax=Euplotes crassus TaxID=5936 RepID=A0AAD1Y4G0_EUPCR|nr:unnamed protein product [Moneuplotes crassus]
MKDLGFNNCLLTISERQWPRKKFAPHLYKKQKLVAGAIKIKTIERKYHKDFLDKRALSCGICDKKVEVRSLIPLSCVHAFHPDCLRTFILEESKNSVPVSCPVCNKQILEREVKILISPDEYDKYIAMILSKTLRDQKQNCIYCYSSIIKQKDSASLKISCNNCKLSYCLNCKEEWEGNHSCHNGRALSNNCNSKSCSDKKCFCTNTEWQSYAKTKKYTSKPSKSQVHSSSAKPTYNRSYKFENFKVKNQAKSKKKQIISVQGIKYSSRPSLQPHSQGNKVRRGKYCLGNFNGDTKHFKFNCQCDICKLITADLSNSNYLDNCEELLHSKNSKVYSSERKSKKTLRTTGNTFLRKYCQGRRERPKDSSLKGIYYDEENDKFQTTGYIHPSDGSYDRDNYDPSFNFCSEMLSAQYSDHMVKKHELMSDPANCELIQQMKKNKSIEEYTIRTKRWNKILKESPVKAEKPNIHKAKSFKTKNVKTDLSAATRSVKTKKMTENPRRSKKPSISCIDSSKDLENSKTKPKTRVKKRCCEGKGGCSGYVPQPLNKPIMIPSKHLEGHPINIAIKNINQFINLAFKIKSKDDYNVPAILNLGKTLGIIYPKSQIVDHNFLRSREFLSFSKEKILRYLYSAINNSNGKIEPDNSKSLISFHQNRFYIGRGNNSILVRSVIKQRWWWSMNEKEDFFKTNFIWTQWRKNKHLSILDAKKECTNQEMNDLKKQILSERADDSYEEESPQQANEEGAPTSASTLFQTKIYNRLENNFHLSNKKALFWNMSEYYKSINKSPWDALPVTFHVENGLSDPEYMKFLNFQSRLELEIQSKTRIKNEVLFKRRKEEEQKQKKNKFARMKERARRRGKKIIRSEPSSSEDESNSSYDSDSEEEESEDDEFKIPKNMWIVKPGENTNRGNGIQVCSSLQEVENIIRTCRPKQEVQNDKDKSSKLEDNHRRTFILQKYIDRPLLIKGRKFDIRAFGTMTSINGLLKGYFYEDGYIRTSSTKYTSKSNDVFIHLTNDAVQKHADNFGKYENGNKLSYHDFQKYLNSHYPEENVCFYRDILPQMRCLVADAFRSVYGKIDPFRRINSFEIYGFDFMIDRDFKVYMIECNTNPCLELPCPLLTRVISGMLDNSFRIAIDPLFPPSDFSFCCKRTAALPAETKYQLVFDEEADGSELSELLKKQKNCIFDIEEEEEDDQDEGEYSEEELSPEEAG